MNGAPSSANGSAVPRPSERFVPSKRHVPGYRSAVSYRGIARLGMTHGRPQPGKDTLGSYPSQRTMSSAQPMFASAFTMRANSPQVMP